MKTIDEIEEKVKSDFDDPIECIMVQLCSGIHPLSDFVVECFKEEHKDKVMPLTEENIIALMQGYIDFAFKKANDMRGISANRSIWKYSMWLWALDDSEFGDFEFSDYGISILNRIAKKYKLKTNNE